MKIVQIITTKDTEIATLIDKKNHGNVENILTSVLEKTADGRTLLKNFYNSRTKKTRSWEQDRSYEELV